MENATIFQTFLLTLAVCLMLTVGLIILINKGLKQFYEKVSQDHDIANFFTRLTNIILLLGGLSAAMASSYTTGEDANWLTLTWDIADQLEESLSQLFFTLMIFTIAFLILHLMAKRTVK
ncbi:MAG: hypothetical protein JKY52_18890 [Flavobacteriales bacterium]|nr:hypothetical protein [Flavobacteriales bacterium]